LKKTESAGGVVVNRGRIALVLQRGEVWSLPKGHLKKREGHLDAAIREIREETGLTQISLIRELGIYERPKIGLNKLDDPTELKRIRMFLFLTEEEPLQPEDRKILEARWVVEAEVANLLTHPKDTGFFESIRLVID
jgi:ADP-ribose pyrophosphatase YjhB (NUDIX family)